MEHKRCHEAACFGDSMLAHGLRDSHDAHHERLLTIVRGGGYSNETLMFDPVDRHGQRTGLVARLQPRGPTLDAQVGLNRQRRMLEILQDCPAVPSPRAWSAVLMIPKYSARLFLITELLDGRVPADDPPFTVGSHL